MQEKEIKEKTQWMKRVELTQFFYMCLINQYANDKINESALTFDFDAQQMEVIYFYTKNHNEILQKIKENLKQNWSWQRIPLVTQSIIFVAYCEFFSRKTPKAICIDQALITADRYGQLTQRNFINAILDKLLV